MSIKYLFVTIWILAVCSSSAWALQGEPEQLWQILSLEAKPSQGTHSQSSAHAGHSPSNKKQPLAANVALDKALLSNLSEGQYYRIVTPEGEHTLLAASMESSAAGKTWTLTQDSAKTLPAGKLFISKAGVSAWLPTSNGLWRLHNNT